MQPTIVSREDWLAARKALLAKELEMTHALDALRAERRQMPWVKIEKGYVFDGPDGKCTLLDLFEDRSQARHLPLHAHAGLRPYLSRLFLYDGSRRRGAAAFRAG
ncbi:DUF899 family protein [Devosia algicola]|uniref:DUF899 family protein n=1 Tax=Devosia algicola TaxID=3026418 RepID=UPI002E1A2820